MGPEPGAGEGAAADGLACEGFISTTSALRFSGFAAAGSLGASAGLAASAAGSSGCLGLCVLPSALCPLPFLDHENRLPDFDLVPGFDFRFFDDAVHRRRDFDRGFVGFELEDRLVFLDRVAGLHHDPKNISTLDVLAQLGELHVCRHFLLAFYETAGFFFSGSIPRSLMAFSTSLASICLSRANAESAPTAMKRASTSKNSRSA